MKVIVNDFVSKPVAPKVDTKPQERLEEPDKLSVSFCTTCMGRLQHLKETLPYNIQVLNEMDIDYEICLVNWGSKDGMHEWVIENYTDLINNGKLKYLKLEKDYFERSPAKNAAHELATKSYVCNIDADNFITKEWMLFCLGRIKEDSLAIIGGKGNGGACGRILCSRDMYLQVGGYDNWYKRYGNEDGDLVVRLIEIGCNLYYFNHCKVINHDNEIRHCNEKVLSEKELKRYKRQKRRRLREIKRKIDLHLEEREAGLDAKNHTFSSLWIGELSKQEIACMKSFVDKGYNYNLYTYGPMKNIPKGVVQKDANEILKWDEVKHIDIIAWISDYFRYMLLHKTNEIWVDTDIYCLRHMPFLDDEYILGKERKGRKSEKVANCIMRMPKDCPVLLYLINLCKEKIEKDDIVWGENGIKIFDGLIRENELFDVCKSIKTFFPIHYRELGRLTKRCDYSEILKDGETYAIHLWNSLLDAVEYEEGSLYSYLINRDL